MAKMKIYAFALLKELEKSPVSILLLLSYNKDRNRLILSNTLKKKEVGYLIG